MDQSPPNFSPVALQSLSYPLHSPLSVPFPPFPAFSSIDRHEACARAPCSPAIGSLRGKGHRLHSSHSEGLRQQVAEGLQGDCLVPRRDTRGRARLAGGGSLEAQAARNQGSEVRDGVVGLHSCPHPPPLTPPPPSAQSLPFSTEVPSSLDLMYEDAPQLVWTSSIVFPLLCGEPPISPLSPSPPPPLRPFKNVPFKSVPESEWQLGRRMVADTCDKRFIINL